MLYCLTSTEQSDWSHLPWTEYAHNSHVITATKLSPFEASLITNLPFFLQKRTFISHPFSITSFTAVTSGKTPSLHFNTGTSERQKVWLAARDYFSYVIFPGSSAHTKSFSSLVPPPWALTILPVWKSIPHSTSLSLSDKACSHQRRGQQRHQSLLCFCTPVAHQKIR